MIHKKILLGIKLGLIFLFSIAIVNNAFAYNKCDAVLQYGIFDRSNSLNQIEKYNLIKEASCGSNSSSFEHDGSFDFIKMFNVDGSFSKKEREDFCNSSFEDARNNRKYISLVSKASKTIADSWLGCIKNTSGVSHYIEPTSDPSIFTYKIQFQSTGVPYTSSIISWNISGVTKCKDELPHKGQKIDSSGYEIQCFRDPLSTVVVTANLTSSGSDLRRVLLPAFRKITSPLITIPNRTSFSLDGKRYRSIGYWNNGANQTTFNSIIKFL